MRLVHIQTVIQTTFGVLDEDGNAIPQEPVVVNVQKFSAEAFTDAHRAIDGAREQALQDAESAPASAANAAARRTRPRR